MFRSTHQQLSLIALLSVSAILLGATFPASALGQEAPASEQPDAKNYPGGRGMGGMMGRGRGRGRGGGRGIRQMK